MNNPLIMVWLLGFLVLLVFFTFLAVPIRKRISGNVQTAFQQLLSKHQLRPQEHYFILDNMLGFPQAFLVCEMTSFAIINKKTAELECIPYDQVKVLKLPRHVVFGKAELVKTDGSRVPIKLNQDMHIDFEKDWPEGVRNKILLQALLMGKVGRPGKTANKQVELQLRLTYVRLAEACEKRCITVETTSWYRNLRAKSHF